MKEIWRKLKKIIFVLISLCLMFGASMPTYAYTEEEIAQARAWLSAHGYSPDRSGATAAYRDYLNGRFDEELGRITTEETSESTTEEAAANGEREAGSLETTENNELPEMLQNPFDGELEENLEETTNTEASLSAGMGIDSSKENGRDVTVELTATSDAVSRELLENEQKPKDTDMSDEAMLKEKTNRTYREVLIVIGISIGIMAVIEILLYMKRI